MRYVRMARVLVGIDQAADVLATLYEPQIIAMIPQALRIIATERVKAQDDVIVVSERPTAAAASAATSRIPIVD